MNEVEKLVFALDCAFVGIVIMGFLLKWFLERKPKKIWEIILNEKPDILNGFMANTAINNKTWDNSLWVKRIAVEKTAKKVFEITVEYEIRTLEIVAGCR